MKVCPYCGRYCDDNAKICANCGGTLPEVSPANPAGDPAGAAAGFAAAQQNAFQNASFGQAAPQNNPYGQQNQYQNNPYAQQPQYQNNPYAQQPQYPNGPYAPNRVQAPRVNTKKEFLNLPANAKLKKELSAAAIICYICAGLTLLLSFALGSQVEGPVDYTSTIISVAIILGLGLGIHLKQSRLCAVLLLIVSIGSTVITFIQTQQFGGWLVIVAGVIAVIYTFQLEKKWKEYQSSQF